jgi:hypothetical protein
MFKFQIKCEVKRLDTRLFLSSISDMTSCPICPLYFRRSISPFIYLKTYNISSRYFTFSLSLNMLSTYFILAESYR